MAKDWRCRLSFHKYGYPKRNDTGEVYLECIRCGHINYPEPPSAKPPPMAGGEGMMGM